MMMMGIGMPISQARMPRMGVSFDVGAKGNGRGGDGFRRGGH